MSSVLAIITASLVAVACVPACAQMVPEERPLLPDLDQISLHLGVQDITSIPEAGPDIWAAGALDLPEQYIPDSKYDSESDFAKSFAKQAVADLFVFDPAKKAVVDMLVDAGTDAATTKAVSGDLELLGLAREFADKGGMSLWDAASKIVDHYDLGLRLPGLPAIPGGPLLAACEILLYCSPLGGKGGLDTDVSRPRYAGFPYADDGQNLIDPNLPLIEWAGCDPADSGCDSNVAVALAARTSSPSHP